MSEPSTAKDSNNYRQRIAELFETHNQKLLRFLTHRLHSLRDAEEVAQEAYVRLLQLDAPEKVCCLRAFLFKTAANLAIDRLKSSTRRGQLDQLESCQDPLYEPSLETGFAAQQILLTTLLAIDELPPKWRHAFLRHRLHGERVADIAQSMDLAVRTIQLYVERAMIHCAARLQDGEQNALRSTSA